MTFYVALILSGRDGTPKVGEPRTDVRAEGASHDEARERAIDEYAAARGVDRSRVWFFGMWPA